MIVHFEYGLRDSSTETLIETIRQSTGVELSDELIEKIGKPFCEIVLSCSLDTDTGKIWVHGTWCHGDAEAANERTPDQNELRSLKKADIEIATILATIRPTVPAFSGWRSGYHWIMSKLGGLDPDGDIRATPYTEAEIVRFAVMDITDEPDLSTLRDALAAMGWTGERLSRLLIKSNEEK